MSKPLATKVSTPLSENVQIGPKVSIFCVATIIFQHYLNPLGHGVHQSKGCHWSSLPPLHYDITELVDVGDFALLHPPFEDAPQITFTLNFFSKAVVVLEVCLGSLPCWNTALRPSLQRPLSLPSGATAMQTNLMQCAVYGLSTDRLTPIPSTSAAMLAALIHLFPKHNSGYDAEHVHSTSLVDHGEACSEWNLSCWTCPPLYGLGHRAVAQFQGLGNLLIVYASLCRATIIFFRYSESPLPWGAMLNFQWPIWESESDNTKFNTPEIL